MCFIFNLIPSNQQETHQKDVISPRPGVFIVNFEHIQHIIICQIYSNIFIYNFENILV